MRRLLALKNKFSIEKDSKLSVILFAIIFAAVGVILVVFTRAQTPTTNFEPEAGTPSGNVSVVADTGASAGNAVKFGMVTTPPPTGSSRCPAYPAFPDASCTGVIAGTQLTNCSSNITQANAVYTNCLFQNGLALGTNAKNVKITNSRIMGTIYAVSPNIYDMNLVMTDVEINGGNSDADGLGGIFGYTCIRCNMHNASKGFAGGNFHIEDSYIHDMYGVRSCTKFPGDCQSHNEAILPFDGDSVLLHNTIQANYNAASTGGGMSAAIAIYTHGTFWGSKDNIRIEKNLITNTESPYCMYLGNTSDTDGNPSGIRIIDNVFGYCTEFLGWLRGNGNVWTNNRRTTTTGAVIAEPPTSEYN